MYAEVLMKADILFIAPTEKMGKMVKELIWEREEAAEVKVLQEQGALPMALQVAREGIERGIKVVVSRKGTQRFLENHLPIPVIGVEVTSADYSPVFEKAKELQGPIAFFSYEGLIPEDIKTFCQLLQIDGRYYEFSDDETCRDSVIRAAREGAVLGCGGSISERYSREIHFPHITVETSKQSVRNALDAARQMVHILELENKRKQQLQLRLERYETIFNYTHDGIIAIDKEGKVEIVNKQAEAILPLKNKPYMGKYIEEVLPDTKLPAVLREGEKQTDELMRIKDVVLNTNRIPIVINNEVCGVVATFRDIDSIRVTEQKIRSNLHKKGFVPKARFYDIHGESNAIKRAMRIAKGYAKTESPILLLGELGTGKEMFAQSIHWESKRKKQPFVTVNCMAMSEEAALEALFGLAKEENGKGGKPGLIEMAHEGTIFFDEIGELSRNNQARILRVMQEKEVRRIGGEDIIPVDVRFIASTKRDLLKEMEQGNFLESLFYRLGVLTLKLPPLREREQDYHLIAEDMFRKFLREDFRLYEKQIYDILAELTDYPWKGNIRELSNIVERVSVLLMNEVTKEEILQTLEIYTPLHDGSGKKIKLEKWTRAVILEALQVSRLNISRAAKLLGCSRSTLYKKMAEFDIHIADEE